MKRLHGLLIAVVSSFIGKAVEAAQQPGYRNAVEVRFLPGADLSPPLNAISGLSSAATHSQNSKNVCAQR